MRNLQVLSGLVHEKHKVNYPLQVFPLSSTCVDTHITEIMESLPCAGCSVRTATGLLSLEGKLYSRMQYALLGARCAYSWALGDG